MPIYEFKCRDCGKISEIICGVTEDNKTIRCSYCSSRNLEKILSAPASLRVAEKAAYPSAASGCCGTTNPCDNPKRCCTKD